MGHPPILYSVGGLEGGPDDKGIEQAVSASR